MNKCSKSLSLLLLNLYLPPLCLSKYRISKQGPYHYNEEWDKWMLIAHDVHKCNGELVEDAALERVETSMVDIPLTFNLQISSSSWQKQYRTYNRRWTTCITLMIQYASAYGRTWTKPRSCQWTCTTGPGRGKQYRSPSCLKIWLPRADFAFRTEEFIMVNSSHRPSRSA